MVKVFNIIIYKLHIFCLKMKIYIFMKEKKKKKFFNYKKKKNVHAYTRDIFKLVIYLFKMLQYFIFN